MIPQAIIYRLHSPSLNLNYIGSTVKSLDTRLSEHKRAFIHKDKICSSFKVLSAGDVQIESIEILNKTNKATVKEREQIYINMDNTTVNKEQEEIREDIQEYQQIIQHINLIKPNPNNSEKVYTQQYYLEYRKVNWDRLIKYNREYQTKNKELLEKKRRLKKYGEI